MSNTLNSEIIGFKVLQTFVTNFNILHILNKLRYKVSRHIEWLEVSYVFSDTDIRVYLNLKAVEMIGPLEMIVIINSCVNDAVNRYLVTRGSRMDLTSMLGWLTT
jgi:hypothetical protein